MSEMQHDAQHDMHQGDGHEDGDEHVHVFEESGIEEGNKPVPKWYVFVALGIFVFFVAYIALYLTGVQPNTAR